MGRGQSLARCRRLFPGGQTSCGKGTGILVMISGFGVIKGQRFPFGCASSEPSVFCFLTKTCSYRSALLFRCKPEILVFLICSPGESNAVSLPLLYNVGFFLPLPAWRCPQTCPTCSCIILLLRGPEPCVCNTQMCCAVPSLKSPGKSVDFLPGRSSLSLAYWLPNHMQ